MRTKHSLRNVTVGVASQMLIVIVGFVSRKIFIVTLGGALLGINALYTSVISMLSLTELGIGTAIICNLYKPLAENDKQRIASLVQFYEKAYRLIGFIVLLLGFALMPFLNLLLKEPMDPVYLAVVFGFFLSDTVISYFFAHKRSLIFADQRNDIVTIVSTVSTVSASLVQIAVLLVTKNYVLYLSIKVIIRVIENFIISRIADKRYPYLKHAPYLHLDKETKGNIVINTKALSMHFVGNYLINGTDNIIITRFLGVLIAGLYSNYFLIVSTLRIVISQFSTGIIASFGNMIAKEKSEKSQDVLKKAFFINFVVYNFVSVSLLCLFNPFITLWIGEASLLSMPVVMIISLNFYIVGISEVMGSLRSSAGIFRPDKYLHIFLAALNLIVSIGLVQVIGMIGIFLGTLLCLLIKEITVLPHIVYKYIIKTSVRQYYKMLIPCILTTFASTAVALCLCYYIIGGNGILAFIIKCVSCLIIPNALVVIVFNKRDEYRYCVDIIKSIVLKKCERDQKI